MKVQSQFFPSLTDEQAFQDYFLSKTIISNQSSVSWENGLCKTIFQVIYSIDSRLCLPGDLTNECVEPILPKSH